MKKLLLPLVTSLLLGFAIAASAEETTLVCTSDDDNNNTFKILIDYSHHTVQGFSSSGAPNGLRVSDVVITDELITYRETIPDSDNYYDVKIDRTTGVESNRPCGNGTHGFSCSQHWYTSHCHKGTQQF
jgi:hypothetical protein